MAQLDLYVLRALTYTKREPEQGCGGIRRASKPPTAGLRHAPPGAVVWADSAPLEVSWFRMVKRNAPGNTAAL